MVKEYDGKFKDPVLRFERLSHTDLWDTSIKCSDGSIIKAHRCILAARLEYFNGMFAHSWSEVSIFKNYSNEKLKISLIIWIFRAYLIQLYHCQSIVVY